jgi:hypothetical protein
MLPLPVRVRREMVEASVVVLLAVVLVLPMRELAVRVD